MRDVMTRAGNEAPASRSGMARILWPLLVVAALAITPYLSTPFNFWVGDDYNYLFPKGLDRVLGFFDPTVSSRAFYRPFNFTAWAIDFALYGKSPFGWHVTSILIHVVAAVAAAMLATLLLRSRVAGVLAGALFAVHPSHPETVTWIGGRADEVCGLFYIPAALFFVLYLQSRGTPSTRSKLYYALALACAAGALFGKEMGVTLPLVLLLADAVFFGEIRRARDSASRWKRLLPHLPFILLVGAYATMRVALVALGVVTNTYAGPSLVSLGGLLNSATANILLAVGVWSGPDFAVVAPLWTRLVIVATGLLAAVALLKWLGRAAVFGLGWFVLALLPTYNLAAPRWLYIPSFGVCFVLAAAYGRLSHDTNARRRAAAAVLAGLLIFSWGNAVIVQNVLWYRSGEEAKGILNGIAARVSGHPERPLTIYFAGAPSRRGPALLFNTGLSSAMEYLYPGGKVSLHEIEQPLPDPVIVDALATPSRLAPNPLFLGYRGRSVVSYATLAELLATGVGK